MNTTTFLKTTGDVFTASSFKWRIFKRLRDFEMNLSVVEFLLSVSSGRFGTFSPALFLAAEEFWRSIFLLLPPSVVEPPRKSTLPTRSRCLRPASCKETSSRRSWSPWRTSWPRPRGTAPTPASSCRPWTTLTCPWWPWGSGLTDSTSTAATGISPWAWISAPCPRSWGAPPMMISSPWRLRIRPTPSPSCSSPPTRKRWESVFVLFSNGHGFSLQFNITFGDWRRHKIPSEVKKRLSKLSIFFQLHIFCEMFLLGPKCRLNRRLISSFKSFI